MHIIIDDGEGTPSHLLAPAKSCSSRAIDVKLGGNSAMEQPVTVSSFRPFGNARTVMASSLFPLRSMLVTLLALALSAK